MVVCSLSPSLDFASFNNIYPTDETKQNKVATDTTGNRRIFFGDSKICYTDSCEFFLLCWLTGGLIQKSCGGFLFACCHRPGVSPDPATPYVDSLEHPDVNYGPVQRDSRTYSVISFFFFLISCLDLLLHTLIGLNCTDMRTLKTISFITILRLI